MGIFTTKHKNEIGRDADELFFRSEKKIENIRLRIIDFNSKQIEEVRILKSREANKHRAKDSVTWFNIDGLYTSDAMMNIAKTFELDR